MLLRSAHIVPGTGRLVKTVLAGGSSLRCLAGFAEEYFPYLASCLEDEHVSGGRVGPPPASAAFSVSPSSTAVARMPSISVTRPSVCSTGLPSARPVRGLAVRQCEHRHRGDRGPRDAERGVPRVITGGQHHRGRLLLADAADGKAPAVQGRVRSRTGRQDREVLGQVLAGRAPPLLGTGHRADLLSRTGLDRYHLSLHVTG
jgi:hypothetical protein